MTKDSGASGDGLTRELEEILFACLERPPAEREAALAAACALHPERAEALRRCWLHIGRMQRRHGMERGGSSAAEAGESGAATPADG